MLYSATMSLDGFIAGPGGDMSWLTPYLGPNPEVEKLIARTGSILVGNRTFGGDDPHRDDPEKAGKVFGGGWEGIQFVLTHIPPARPVEGIAFVTDLESGISQSKAAAGDKDVLIIGADVARQCIEAGELDEIFLGIAPVLLGDGTRLFDVPGGRNVKLRRVSQSETQFGTSLRFKVVQQEREMGNIEFPRSMGKVAPRELTLNGITRYEHLTECTEKELLAIHGVGPKATRILREELASRGLSFRDE